MLFSVSLLSETDSDSLWLLTFVTPDHLYPVFLFSSLLRLVLPFFCVQFFLREPLSSEATATHQILRLFHMITAQAGFAPSPLHSYFHCFPYAVRLPLHTSLRTNFYPPRFIPDLSSCSCTRLSVSRSLATPLPSSYLHVHLFLLTSLYTIALQPHFTARQYFLTRR